MRGVSVVIPTFNGRDLLDKNLPPLFDALRRTESPSEVIVVDDASTDDSVSMLAERFPTVTVIRNERNLGFAETINLGFFSARHDVILALNNDVTVDPDLFTKSLSRFDDASIFSVTPNIIDPTTGKQQAIVKLVPGFCWFRDVCLPTPPSEEEVSLFFASGGSSFLDRKKLLEIGGFSSLYFPFYVEDVDLSYQAWKRGWKCVLEPSVTAWHPVNSTIRKYHKRRKTKLIVARNKHMFMWVNVTNRHLIAKYLALFIPSLMLDVLLFRKYKFIGMFAAFSKINEILAERRRRRQFEVVSDLVVIDKTRV